MCLLGQLGTFIDGYETKDFVEIGRGVAYRDPWWSSFVDMRAFSIGVPYSLYRDS